MTQEYEYLMSPYTAEDEKLREWRYEQACKAAAILMERGHRVFAPIPHSHAIEKYMTQRYGMEFWMRQDIPLLAGAARGRVLMLDGWKQSKGVQQEIKILDWLGRPISYMEPE